MGYVDDHLLNGENIGYRAHQHWVIFFWPVFLMLAGTALLILVPDQMIFGLAVLGLAVLWLIFPLIKYSTSEYAVTNKRVIVKLGLVQRDSSETLLSKVEAIAVDQTIPGRLLGFGTITITGTGGTKESFARISSPMEFRRQVQAQIVEMEDRRGSSVTGESASGEPREERECPYCAERILKKARVCRFCDREVSPAG
ncbi:MAG: PH domain-containing protein [Gemmatimonadota bacterium]